MSTLPRCCSAGGSSSALDCIPELLAMCTYEMCALGCRLQAACMHACSGRAGMCTVSNRAACCRPVTASQLWQPPLAADVPDTCVSSHPRVSSPTLLPPPPQYAADSCWCVPSAAGDAVLDRLTGQRQAKKARGGGAEAPAVDEATRKLALSRLQQKLEGSQHWQLDAPQVCWGW
jgi:hypothetical protein